MSELEAFLEFRTPDAEEQETWAEMPLRIQSFRSTETPPLKFVSSVRCVILRGSDEVLLLTNPDGYRVLPGGRREEGESLLETLRRELLEETGWTIKNPRRLGFIYFRHLVAKPPDYPFPYPEFAQLVYTAQADIEQPDAKLPDDYEAHAEFRLIAEVRNLLLPARDRLFLEASL